MAEAEYQRKESFLKKFLCTWLRFRSRWRWCGCSHWLVEKFTVVLHAEAGKQETIPAEMSMKFLRKLPIGLLLS